MRKQMNTLLIITSAVSALLLLLVAPATAAPDECDPTGSWSACLGARNGKVSVSARSETSSVSVGGRRSKAQQRKAATAAFCRDATRNAGAGLAASWEVQALCREFLPLPRRLGEEDIRRAFEELPLYRGAIRTEPRLATLVNLETSFWCGDQLGRSCAVVGEGERRVNLLGRTVRIRPRIVGYSWAFGDGAVAESDGRAAHTYRHAGEHTVTLTLTWTADYAVGDGAMQPIDDTTTTTSPPRVLPVREAQTVIVGG